MPPAPDEVDEVDLVGDVDAGHLGVAEARDHEVVYQRHEALDGLLGHDGDRDGQHLAVKRSRSEERPAQDRLVHHNICIVETRKNDNGARRLVIHDVPVRAG